MAIERGRRETDRAKRETNDRHPALAWIKHVREGLVLTLSTERLRQSTVTTVVRALIISGDPVRPAVALSPSRSA